MDDEHTRDEVGEMATDGYIHYYANPPNFRLARSFRSFLHYKCASLHFARRRLQTQWQTERQSKSSEQSSLRSTIDLLRADLQSNRESLRKAVNVAEKSASTRDELYQQNLQLTKQTHELNSTKRTLQDELVSVRELHKEQQSLAQTHLKELKQMEVSE